jgi:hypothetical protein
MVDRMYILHVWLSGIFTNFMITDLSGMMAFRLKPFTDSSGK